METTKTAVGTQSDSQLHFLDYWRIIRIRKTVILAVFLLVVLTTTAVTFWLPQWFMSSVRIAVEKDNTDIAPIGSLQTPTPFDPYFIQTEFEKIQSTSVLYPVIDLLRLRERWAQKYNEPSLTRRETFQLLRKNLDVRQSRNTSLIEIRVYSQNANEAAEIANEIAKNYAGWRVKQRHDQNQKGIAALETNLNEQNEKVMESQRMVDDLRAKLKIPDALADAPAFQASIERETVSGLEQDRIRAESDYQFALTKVEKLLKLDRTEMRKAILTVVPTEPRLPDLYMQLDSTRQRLVQMRQDQSEVHPDVVRLVALEKEIDRQIDERLDGIIEGLKNSVAASKARLDNMSTQVETARSRAAEAAKNSRPYFQAKRDLENQQKIRDAILLRTLQERVDDALPKTGIAQIVDQAEVASRPDRPNIPLNIALGIIVGLVMGVGLAFFIEYLDTSVKTIDDVERALQAPVLGVIPQNVGILLEEGPDSPHAEAYRVLRTNVLFSRKDVNANTLTVVSGGAGEGKSTTIFNLATIFAQNGQRVLVVDSDLRRPSLHKMLNLSNNLGLTNYLLKQNTLEEVVQTTKLPTLDFMPSGKLPSSSLGILNSQRMKDFIREVKARYDFVFFDSPPIMGVSDASILASEVDLAMLVVQYRKYPQAMTLRAKQMVEKVGGTLLGVVLNNINISQDSYYYYYSGYYYDYYSKYEDQGEKEKDGGKKKGSSKSSEGRDGKDAKKASTEVASNPVDIKPKY